MRLLDQPSRAHILTLAHQAALARYKTDPALALRLLGYGICREGWDSARDGVRSRCGSRRDVPRAQGPLKDDER